MFESKYKPFKEIDFGFSDAENYNTEKKEMFKRVFVDNQLVRLIDRHTFYLIGEKGTGKTAYAVFFEANDYKNTKSVRLNLDNSDIISFINMKQAGHLPLSDYKAIWEVVLLIKVIKCIEEKDLDGTGSLRRQQYDAMVAVLEKYNLTAFTPELVSTLEIIQKKANDIASEITASVAALKGTAKKNTTSEKEEHEEAKVIQGSIYKLKQSIVDVIKKIRLKKNYFLFIDRVDVFDVTSISFDEYKPWIKALAETVYNLNINVLGQIKGSEGFVKIILLIRPDIFDKLNMHNQGNRIRDNSVILDWQTSYKEYRHSYLFKLADNLLRDANREIDSIEKKPLGFYWDLYFGWKSTSTNPATRSYDDAFISFLRLSLCRPRDIIEFLNSIKKQAILVDSQQIGTTFECFHSYSCQKYISDYFLQEARDWCLYKYPNGEFDTIKFFFGFMNTGKAVTYDQYLTYYSAYFKSCKSRNNIKIFPEMETPEDFLQLLYDLNMICYIETNDSGEKFQTYCYRMRSISDLSPQIPPNKEYRIHRALLKSLNIET